MRVLALLVVLAGTFAFAACTGGGTDDPAASGSAPATACAADTRKDIYTAGLTKPAGSLQVKLLDSEPGPPQKGTNKMTIQIVDAAGQPVDRADVTVTPFMPDHGHGSPVQPEVTPLGDGKYAVDKVYLAMAGLWRLTVSVQTGSDIEEAAFQFCLDG